MSQSSKIFVRNRALGYVSNHIPCVIRYIKSRQEHIIVTCIGRSLHTYSFSHFLLIAVSDTTEEDITCLAADSQFIYTASGQKIHTWKRCTEIVQTFIGHAKPVHLLLPFGRHLISVDEDSILKVWDLQSEEVFLELTFDNESFKVTAITHPSTYLNKILLGSEQGSMQLWNIKTSTLIYTFKGWDAAITVLEQAPALDVTAIGLSNGKIILHNLKYDETILQFVQDWGAVTSISFRTDGPPIMVTGSTAGNVVFWNLEEKKVASQLLEPHNGTVSACVCLPGESIMITSSPDNSVKAWVFDQPDMSARLLRFREGHAAQPSFIRFHGSSGVNILSAGHDSSLRNFSTECETSNSSLGRAYYNKKTAKKKKAYAEALLMPPIVEFTTETTREKEWDNIAAIHLGIPLVTTWSYDKKKMGELKLLPERWAESTRATLNVIATSLVLTNCGNFVIIGYSSGHVERFNIQSGIHRCTYGSPSAHKGIIRGVAADPLNQMVISGCSNGIIKFWKFKPVPSTLCAKPSAKVPVPDGVSFFRMHKESSLVGIILEDFTVCLIDIETKTIVRKLSGHTGQITDAAFSPNARWIITSSMDATIRTWDLVTTSLIDCFKVDSPCISLSMSPTGNYLATAHVNNLGIYLWSNRTLFSYISLRPLSDEENIPQIDLPLSTGAEGVIAMDEDMETEELQGDEDNSPEQISDLITLSNLPTSRWLNLLDIDAIKKRNKPKEPPKVPVNAPFFLPTLPTIDLQFDFSSTVSEEDGIKNTRLDILQNFTAFGKLLKDTFETENFLPVVEKLKSMGPSAIDFEINTFGIEAQGSDILLLQFMKTINFLFSTNKDYELAQAYLSLFLKVHGLTIAKTPSLHSYLQKLQKGQVEGWKELEKKLLYCICVVETLKK